MPTNRSRPPLATAYLLALWGMVAAYAGYFCLVAWVRYTRFAYHDFDLANFSQMCWNICRGSLDSSVLGINFLGNHVSAVLFLLAPFYCLWPSPLSLLLIQAVLLGCTAVPIFMLARRELAPGLSLGIACAYLLYPPLHYVNNFEFHPVALTVFFLAWALYFYYRGGYGFSMLFLALTLSCKENMGLPVIAMGVMALFQRRPWKWSVVPIAAGCAWLYLCLGVIKPLLGNALVGHLILYTHLGESYGEILFTAAAHPLETIAFVLTPVKIKLLCSILLPLGFLPLLAPGVLAMSFPVLFQHLLSWRTTEHSIGYHYTAPLIPFIFAAAVFGAKRLVRAVRWRGAGMFLAFALPLFAIASQFAGGPHSRLVPLLARSLDDSNVPLKNRLVSRIPAGAPLVATFTFLPALANRAGLYSFHNIYTGIYTMSGIPFVLPPDVDLALVDSVDPYAFRYFENPQGPENYRRFLEEGKWGVRSAAGNIVLWERGYEGGVPLIEEIAGIGEGREMLEDVGGLVGFCGFDLKSREVKRGESLELATYWRRGGGSGASVGLLCIVIDGDGKIVHRIRHPLGYQFLPSRDWGEGALMREILRFYFPGDIAPGEYLLGLHCYDIDTGKMLSMEAPGDVLREGRQALIKLGAVTVL